MVSHIPWPSSWAYASTSGGAAGKQPLKWYTDIFSQPKACWVFCWSRLSCTWHQEKSSNLRAESYFQNHISHSAIHHCFPAVLCCPLLLHLVCVVTAGVWRTGWRRAPTSVHGVCPNISFFLHLELPKNSVSYGIPFIFKPLINGSSFWDDASLSEAKSRLPPPPNPLECFPS